MGEVRISSQCSKGRFSVKDISALTFAVQSFVTLFVIMDPPGATPIFLGLVADKSPRVRRILAIQAAAVSLLVISIFALFGRAILNYLNISMEAFSNCRFVTCGNRSTNAGRCNPSLCCGLALFKLLSTRTCSFSSRFWRFLF